jgi:glycogen phosphorylase
MESMASLGIPAFGYGIRYDNGLFKQRISDGSQVEIPDRWLANGTPWEIERRGVSFKIGFGGSVEAAGGPASHAMAVWRPAEIVYAQAYDMPVVGWRGKRVNTLRLWSARAKAPLRLDQFNGGDHVGALYNKTRAESINQVLYPSDATAAGQELRLRQEYFFTAASVQDLLARHVSTHKDVRNLADKASIQLNDTHPSIAVAELMRLLMDEHHLTQAEAWAITQKTISYTNHTLLPEALESWTVHLMQTLLPRHMQIIYALDELLAHEVKALPGDNHALAASVALVDRHGDWRVRMGNLAFAGSHKVNGVSQLHTDLMKVSVFKDMDKLYPGRIINKTNGVTPRRWLQGVNPDLTELITATIGEKVLDDLSEISKLKPFADDAGFRAKFIEVKRADKVRLANLIRERLDVQVDPSALFDVQIKRIHEYKRQLMNIVQTVALYNAMKAKPEANWAPRVKIFAGKAAPSYFMAKRIIHLINDVATTVNADASLRGRLKVAFLPNYNVSLAEVIIPAADLSEQISTAGMEASGTGNMKFALNGAVTIGTLDGANVEMSEHIGLANMMIFGLTAAEVAERRTAGLNPRAQIEASPSLKGALDAIGSGVFSGGDHGRYREIVENLYAHDWFMVTADFDAYEKAQARVDTIWADPARWAAMAVHNTASMGWFSSDRAVREYARDIWNVPVS